MYPNNAQQSQYQTNKTQETQNKHQNRTKIWLSSSTRTDKLLPRRHSKSLRTFLILAVACIESRVANPYTGSIRTSVKVIIVKQMNFYVRYTLNSVLYFCYCKLNVSGLKLSHLRRAFFAGKPNWNHIRLGYLKRLALLAARLFLLVCFLDQYCCDPSQFVYDKKHLCYN